jgi:large subunit ribosomal protein L13
MSVYRQRDAVGSDRGPNYPKRPDRIFKRSVRGMVPYKQTRGREALERVRVYVGNPYDDAAVLEGTSLDRLSNIKFVSLGDVSENLGANVTW